MNYDQYTGIVRAVVPAIVGYLAAAFHLMPETTALVITAVTAIAAAIWSVLNNKSGKTIA
jgi:hypothetical protein